MQVMYNAQLFALYEVKRSQLFYSMRVVEQRESRLFENVFSAAWITMTKIFAVTALKYREKSTHAAG